MADAPTYRFVRLGRAISRLLLIGLPLLAAVQLRAAGTYDDIIVADLYAVMAGPWACFVALVIAMRPLGGRPVGADFLARSGLLMLGLLVCTLGGLLVLLPFDPAPPLSPWRKLSCWVGAAALPLWSAALWASLQAKSRRRALLEAVVASGAVALGGLIIGLLHELDVWALMTPVAAAGSLLSIGLVLASFEGMQSNTRRVVGASGAVALVVAEVLSLTLSAAPIATAWVTSVVAVDAPTGRVLIGLQLPNRAGPSFAELRPNEGTWELLSTRTMSVKYASGERISLVRRPLPAVLALSAGYAVCRASGECLDGFDGSRPPLVHAHPHLPLVAMRQNQRLAAWDLRDDRRWVVERPDQVIIWPCFEGNDALLWRVRTESGPYLNERLPLADGAVPEQLVAGHEHACADADLHVEGVRFVRGRRAVGKPSRLFGPGLPEDGFVFPGDVSHVDRSGDGRRTFVVGTNPSWVLWIYEVGQGMRGPLPMEPNDKLFLDESGELLAYARHRDHAASLRVQRVDDWAVLDDRPIDPVGMHFGEPFGLLYMLDGRLMQQDVGGEPRVVFPPPED